MRVDDDVRLAVEDLLQVLQRDVEHVADARRQALQEPDVRDRRGQRDVPEALAAHLGLDHLDAALLAHDPPVLHALVLAAVALVVLHRAEDLGAEEPVPLRLEGAVVDGLGLLHLAVRPLADLLRAASEMRMARERERVLGLLEEAEDVTHRVSHCAPSGAADGRQSSAAGRAGRLDQLDVQTQRLQLLDQHVEALGEARLQRVIALDDGLVHAGAAHDVVALHGEELLQRVGRAVGLHRPDLHLAEPLAAELRLAAERLLRDERVGPDRAGVDLVVHQVVELEHVHDAHGDVLVERLAGAAVEEDRLARSGQPGELERALDVGSRPRRRTRASAMKTPPLPSSRARLTSSSSQPLEHSRSPRRPCRSCEELLDLVGRALLVDHRLELAAQLVGAPAEVDLQDLPDVHAARHAERVEDEVDRACRPAR